MHDGSDVVKDIFPKTGTKGKAKHPNSNPTGAKRKSVNRQPRKDDKVWTNKNSGMKSLQYTKEYEDSGNASRYFYCPKTSKSERNVGLDNFTAKPMAWGNQAKAELKRGNLDFKGNQGDGSKHNKVEMRLNTHPTVKPVELMKYLCRLVTPKGGVVLDPFMGSGSTGMAAKDEGFDFIGIEKDEEYFKICESRIVRFAPLMDFM